MILPSTHLSVQPAHPVTWRSANVPITSGHNLVSLRVRLLNPCDILNLDALHKDTVDFARKHCNDLYRTLFLGELAKMCPSDDERQSLFKDHTELMRMKRELLSLSILLAVLIVSVILPIGLGVAGTAMASVNSGKIADIQSAMSRQDRQIELFEERLQKAEKAVFGLETNFNSLLERLQVLQTDYEELKGKQTSSSFAISYVTTRLLTGKAILQEATRKYREGKLTQSFFDYINVTLPCGEDCPVELAHPQRCYLSNDDQDLFMIFTVPVINRTLTLVTADPFTLIHQNENQTCQIEYTGPKAAIMSKAKNCPVEFNQRLPAFQDMILFPVRDCLTRANVTQVTKFFSPSTCQPRYPNGEREIIQLKPLYDELLIYCPGSFLELDDRKERCPDHVFSIPIMAHFRINGDEHTGSELLIDHRQLADPLFTLKANWNLQSKVDFRDLAVHPMIPGVTVPKSQNVHSPIAHQTYLWIVIGILIMLITFLILFFCLYYKIRQNRKIQVKVLAEPSAEETGSE